MTSYQVQIALTLYRSNRTLSIKGWIAWGKKLKNFQVKLENVGFKVYGKILPKQQKRLRNGKNGRVQGLIKQNGSKYNHQGKVTNVWGKNNYKNKYRDMIAEILDCINDIYESNLNEEENIFLLNDLCTL